MGNRWGTRILNIFKTRLLAIRGFPTLLKKSSFSSDLAFGVIRLIGLVSISIVAISVNAGNSMDNLQITIIAPVQCLFSIADVEKFKNYSRNAIKVVEL